MSELRGVCVHPSVWQCIQLHLVLHDALQTHPPHQCRVLSLPCWIHWYDPRFETIIVMYGGVICSKILPSIIMISEVVKQVELKVLINYCS